MDNLEKNTNADRCNSGNWNSGKWNSGNGNSGSFNSGDWNSGDWNRGDCNSGDGNLGYCNSGNRNRGNWNIGSWNIGNGNIGCFNSVSFTLGCFNTPDMPAQKIFLFNKPSDWTWRDWINSEAYTVMFYLGGSPTQWILPEEMSEEEKKEHPEYATTQGYLKTLTKKEQIAQIVKNWNELSDKEKRIIFSIPNFDKEIFKQITGIDVVELESETKEDDRTFIVTEWCDNCDSEIEMRWDTDVRGFQAICPVCGAKLMLCNECRHAPDGGKCDYSAEQGGCWRSKK